MTRNALHSSSPPCLRSAALALVFALACVAAPARAAVTRFEAAVAQPKVMVGERFAYTITIQTDGAFGGASPTQPDFGGLRMLAGPSQSTQTIVENFTQKTIYQVSYLLTGLTAGEFVIGPSQLAWQGQTLQTQPVKVQVASQRDDPQAAEALPPSLRNEPILFPSANDPAVAQALKGLAFIRPVVSKKDPWVGEVFTYEAYLYVDSKLVNSPLAPRGLRFQEFPKFEKLLSEDAFKAQSLDTRTVTVDDRTYQVSLLYRAMLTAPKADEYSLSGFGVRFSVARGNRRPGRSSFDDIFGEPFFTNDVPAEAWAGPVKIVAKPLPDSGQPATVAPSVGQYQFEAGLDRAKLTKDDILTLTMKVRGKGNVAMASAPALHPNDDFDQVDQTQKFDKKLTDKTIVGEKTFEYLLRPKRVGALSIPPIDYLTFDPESGQYKQLKTAPLPVEVTPGQNIPAPAIAADGQSPPPELETGLRYIHTAVDSTMRNPAPLVDNPLYWIAQLGAAGLAGASFVRARRRERIDPVQARREGAWPSLDKKLAKLGPVDQAPTALERALREFVGDRHNLSPEGLTGEEIAARLKEEGVDEAKARRFARILDLCAQARYSPGGSAAAKTDEWAAEAVAILREGLK